MGNLKKKYEEGNVLTHLQVHNIWPIGIGTLITLVGLIFTSGQNYNKFVRLQQDFIEYKQSTDMRLNTCQKTGDDMMKLYVDLSSKLPAVKGVSTKVATPAGSLKVPFATWTPTPRGR